jgi:hypothetical protein
MLIGNTCTNEGDNLVNIAADGNDTIQANIEQDLHKKNHCAGTDTTCSTQASNTVNIAPDCTTNPTKPTK